MKQLLADIYKQLAGSTEYLFRGFHYASDELIVLCMHSTPKSHLPQFEQLLDFLLQHFKPLPPEDLRSYYHGELADGPYVLFTFDDGLRNNLHAANALHMRGIHAYFFLVPGFIQSSNQAEYYQKNIRPAINRKVDKLEEDFEAMSVDEVKKLLADGHSIGVHSYTHTLHGDMNGEELQHEVIESKAALESMFACRLNSFCSINHTTHSVNAICKRMIESNYTFHFTTYPGLNAEEKKPQLIYRRNIEVHWPMGKIKFALGQADLDRWKPVVAHFQHLQ
ncbi:MAG: polysaccharide deacetylase family protein [Flavobacteriales bacterium]